MTVDVEPNQEPFECSACGRLLSPAHAAWDVDPEIPPTICLDCVDGHAIEATRRAS